MTIFPPHAGGFAESTQQAVYKWTICKHLLPRVMTLLRLHSILLNLRVAVLSRWLGFGRFTLSSREMAKAEEEVEALRGMIEDANSGVVHPTHVGTFPQVRTMQHNSHTY